MQLSTINIKFMQRQKHIPIISNKCIAQSREKVFAVVRENLVVPLCPNAGRIVHIHHIHHIIYCTTNCVNYVSSLG